MSRGAGSLLDEHIDPDYQPSEKEARLQPAESCQLCLQHVALQVEEYAEWLGMELWSAFLWCNMV